MEEKRISDDFTQGNIVGKLLKFMIPILGALILQAMYGAVDLLVVGQYGTSAGISAVSTGSNIINLVTFVISGLTMGVTVLISRYLGEQKPERIGKVIGGAVAFFILLTVFLMALLLAFAPVFAGWLKAPEEAYDLTVTYVRICGVGLIFVVAYNVISGIFRGLGNSRLPLIFVAIACVVNIAGDLLFVAGHRFSSADQGISGSGISHCAAGSSGKYFFSDIVRYCKWHWPGRFFRLRNRTKGYFFCNADSFGANAVNVSLCGPECGSGKRRPGKKGHVCGNGSWCGHRGFYFCREFFPGRCAFGALHP